MAQAHSSAVLQRLGGWSTWTWVRASAVLAIAFLTWLWVSRPFVAGDTPFVLDGTNAFLACMDARVFVGCGHTGKLNDWGLTSSIGGWPLLQHVPDLAAIAVGADGHPARTRLLALLSVAGVLGSILLGRLALVRTGNAAWFWGFVVVVLTGPTIAYARSTAGEMLAMGLLVALVTAAVLRAPPWVLAFAAAGAAITKETSYPFVAIFLVVGLLLARARTGEPIRRHLAGGAVGIAVALVATSLLNVVRFGSVLNTNQLEPSLHTHGVARLLEYGAAVVVSPSGGFVVFWPAAAAITLGACVLAFGRGRRREERLVAIALLVVVGGLTLGFARWWTPFGWSQYGPRLMLPWLVPLVLVALVAYGETLARAARRMLTPVWGLLAVFVVLFALTLPHVGNLLRPDRTGEFFATQEPPCEAPFRTSVEEWHACQHELMWLTRPMPLYAAKGAASFEGVFTAIVLGVGLLSGLVLLRRELQATSALGSGTARRPLVANTIPATTTRIPSS